MKGWLIKFDFNLWLVFIKMTETNPDYLTEYLSPMFNRKLTRLHVLMAICLNKRTIKMAIKMTEDLFRGHTKENIARAFTIKNCDNLTPFELMLRSKSDDAIEHILCFQRRLMTRALDLESELLAEIDRRDTRKRALLDK